MPIPSHILLPLFYFFGYATGIGAFIWMAKRRNIATDGIFILLAAGLFGGLLGANMTQYFATGLPGKTVIGGIACGYLAVVLAKRYLGIVRSTGDLFAVAISAGEAVGRWGCFFGGCCYGKVASVPWAVYQDGALRHPTQAYDSIANAVILVILLRLLKRNPPENTIFYVQGILYCFARFCIEFFRDSPNFIGGLTLAQIACIAGFLYFTARFAFVAWPKESFVAFRESLP